MLGQCNDGAPLQYIITYVLNERRRSTKNRQQLPQGYYLGLPSEALVELCVDNSLVKCKRGGDSKQNVSSSTAYQNAERATIPDWQTLI